MQHIRRRVGENMWMFVDEQELARTILRSWIVANVSPFQLPSKHPRDDLIIFDRQFCGQDFECVEEAKMDRIFID
jgi:hypothetical protein